MAVYHEAFPIETQGEVQAIDITETVRRVIRDSTLREGIACVFAAGSTCAVVTNELERGLLETDLPRALERITARDADYAHNASGGDNNGHSHVRSAILGQSVTFPFRGGTPLLGRWQQVLFLELDTRPRTREVIVQLVGE